MAKTKKVAVKKSSQKAAPRKPAAKKSAAKKPARKSSEEKEEILAFVEAFDAENGRGGASAAVKKFGVHQATLSSWKKTPSGNSGAGRKSSKGGNPFERMAVILDDIAALESKIDALKKEYATLRKKI